MWRHTVYACKTFHFLYMCVSFKTNCSPLYSTSLDWVSFIFMGKLLIIKLKIALNYNDKGEYQAGEDLVWVTNCLNCVQILFTCFNQEEIEGLNCILLVWLLFWFCEHDLDHREKRDTDSKSWQCGGGYLTESSRKRDQTWAQVTYRGYPVSIATCRCKTQGASLLCAEVKHARHSLISPVYTHTHTHILEMITQSFMVRENKMWSM